MSYLGEEIKKLGFGLMRLPQKDGKIDVEQTKEMVDHFLNAGFTYFDTAWAIKFAANLDGVITVLSGMSNIEQMDDNISFMKDFTKLSESEEKTIKEALMNV